MFNITSPMADFLYNLFNTGLILGAMLVLGSTIGTVWMGGVKERYSNERVAANEAETATANREAAQARADAARANEGAARANERAAALEKEAANARLEQEKLQSANVDLQERIDAEQRQRLAIGADVERMKPRVLTQQQMQSIATKLALSAISPIRISIENDMACSDCAVYADEIADSLRVSPAITVERPSVMGPGRTSSSGLGFRVARGTQTQSVDAILQALQSANLVLRDLGPVGDWNPGEYQMTILVSTPRH